MVNIRLIFKKTPCMSTQSTPQISDFQKIKRQKISWLCLILMNRKVQSSLKWLLGSSHRDKRLVWRTQGQMQRRLRFCSTMEIKRIHNALICGAFCDINKSLIKSVWNHTKRYPRPFFLILWTSFIPQVTKMLIHLANSHSSFIIVMWFLACQTNTLNCCFLILTTLPASKLIGWLKRSHRSWRRKLEPNPLAV